MPSQRIVGLKSRGWSQYEIGFPLGSEMWGIFTSVASRSSKAERGPLILPGKRQAGVREQLLCRQIARLASFEDRLGDIGGEIAEADNPSEIGSAHSCAHSKRGKGDAVALDECHVEPMCPDEQLDQSRIGFRQAER